MGCLPGYAVVGSLSIVLLTIVRLLQGLSVGGQLMSSLIFTLERHPKSRWGLYGSFVMAAANFGTLLGGLVAFFIRRSLSEEALYTWGWRIPFLSGIIVSLAGYYLKNHGGDDGEPVLISAAAVLAFGFDCVVMSLPPVYKSNFQIISSLVKIQHTFMVMILQIP
jgi:MFS family permease